jgi:hypothetical protein
LVLFVAAYSSYLVLTQVTTAIDPLNSRLLVPLYVPGVVLAAVAVDQLSSVVRSELGTRVIRIAGVVLVVWIAGQALTSAREVRYYRHDEDRYGVASSSEASLVAAVGRLPSGGVVYSNSPDLIWGVVHREPVINSPARIPYRTQQHVPVSEEFLLDAACRRTYLAWFKRPDGSLYTPTQLSTFARLDVMSEDGDGALYRVTRTSPRSGCRS